MYHSEHDADCRNENAEVSADTVRIHIRALPFVKLISDPYIMECCGRGADLEAYTADFARLAGPDIKLVENDPKLIQRALLGYSLKPASAGLSGKMPMTGALDRMGGQQAVLNSFIGRNAVLVKGEGAVCAGRTEQELEEICSAVCGNCAAACRDRSSATLNPVEARFLRYSYLAEKIMRKKESVLK